MHCGFRQRRMSAKEVQGRGVLVTDVLIINQRFLRSHAFMHALLIIMTIVLWLKL